MDQIFRFRNRGISSSSTENSPQFAYKIMYGKMDPTFTGKLYFTPKKLIHLNNNSQIYVDENLKEEWIHKLNNINSIDIRSTCEGHDSKYITHIIFRPNDQNLDQIKAKIKILNKLPDTKSNFDIGNGGLYRIGIATKNWYRSNADNTKWKNWWENSIKSLEETFN